MLGPGHTTSFFEDLQKGLSRFFGFYKLPTKKDSGQRHLNLGLGLAKRTILTNLTNARWHHPSSTFLVEFILHLSHHSSSILLHLSLLHEFFPLSLTQKVKPKRKNEKQNGYRICSKLYWLHVNNYRVNLVLI